VERLIFKMIPLLRRLIPFLKDNNANGGARLRRAVTRLRGGKSRLDGVSPYQATCGFSVGIGIGWRSGLILGVATLLAANLRASDDHKDWVPLKLKLPAPVFAGTPKQAPEGVIVDPPSTNPPVIMLPRDARNIAPKARLTSSDKNATSTMLAKITDGDKEAEEDSVVLLRKGLQWIQFDFGRGEQIFAIAIWHAHDTAKIYRSVIVQVADDKDFTENVRTLFNNDADNNSGLGAGTDRQYFESFQGKTIDARGAHARYVRLYSHGSTESAMNEYTEVEIYGSD
jgi:hypothetical protein